MLPKTPKLLEDIRDAAAFIVWQVIQRDLPGLMAEVVALLAQQETQS